MVALPEMLMAKVMGEPGRYASVPGVGDPIWFFSEHFLQAQNDQTRYLFLIGDHIVFFSWFSKNFPVAIVREDNL